jgi:hypothetical protein
MYTVQLDMYCAGVMLQELPSVVQYLSVVTKNVTSSLGLDSSVIGHSSMKLIFQGIFNPGDASPKGCIVHGTYHHPGDVSSNKKRPGSHRHGIYKLTECMINI